jgi:hypothetical protein
MERALNDDGQPRDTFRESLKRERWDLMSNEWIAYVLGEYAKGYAEAVMASGPDSDFAAARFSSVVQYAKAALDSRGSPVGTDLAYPPERAHK